MARSNGPLGPAGTRPQARRHAGDDAFAPPSGQPNGHWPPTHPGHAAQQGQGQGYHFPPEPEANYGYQQQPAPFDGYQGGQQHDPYAPQQWGQPDPRGYDLGNYMPSGAQQHYPPADPPRIDLSALPAERREEEVERGATALARRAANSSGGKISVPVNTGCASPVITHVEMPNRMPKIFTASIPPDTPE